MISQAWVGFISWKKGKKTFAIFNKFKALFKNQNGCNIKIIHSDRGGEYTSRKFEEYCKNEGIQKKHIAGYTPQQNGVYERRNRIIVEMPRNMINEKGLPKYFWAEAVHTTVHILNRCPTKALKDKTPVEA